jgi:2-beta-glucuronyltransferase
LNRCSRSLFALYGKLPLKNIGEELARTDVFLFDSDHGLLLFDRFKRINPGARFVYRVSDDLTMTGNHPLLLETEQRVAGRFDLVSVPSAYIQRRLAHLPGVILQRHGLRKDLFDLPAANPYVDSRPAVVFVGQRLLDMDFLGRAVRLFTGWCFHVFGAIPNLPVADNLTAHGERPFEEIIPYLKYASIGLQTLVYSPGAEAFTDSLKMQQYTYCGLPIVAPEFLRTDRPHVFYYQPGDDVSVRQALLDASRFSRNLVPRHSVQTWDDLIGTLVAAPLRFGASKIPA